MAARKLQPPVNVDPTRIGDPVLLELYKSVQLVWERSFKNSSTGFNIRAKPFVSFKRATGLVLEAESVRNLRNRAEELGVDDRKGLVNAFVFTSSKSHAYDLFRHLRNAIAHGGIEKCCVGDCEYYWMSDYHRHDITMRGKIQCNLLRGLVTALYKTQKTGEGR